ncbi:MAG: thermonuclease family protein [Pseudomonadota bacterium]
MLTLLTCLTLTAIDGDSIRCNGTNMRMLGPGAPNQYGVDAPEIYRPECERERQLGYIAKDRLTQLLSGAVVADTGVKDRYGRPLVYVMLPGDVTAGEVLMAEGLARSWPGNVGWC